MSEATLPGLIIPVEARIDKLEKALDRAAKKQRKFSDEAERRARDSARKISATYNKMGADGERAFARIGRIFQGRTGWQIQQAGLQFGDFATQVAAGTDAARAFSMQAPQLLGMFGAVGALAGVAAASLTPLAANLLQGAFASEKMEDRLTTLEKATNAYAQAAASADTPVEVLRTTLGAAADEAERLNKAQAVVSGAMAAAALQNAAKGVAGEFGITKFADSATARYDRLANHLDISEDAARDLVEALRAVDEATAPDQIITGVTELYESMIRAAGGADKAAEKFGNQFEIVSKLAEQAKLQAEAAQSADARLVQEFDKNTQQLSKLAHDRGAAERALVEAQKAGDSEKIASMRRVITAIDEQIKKVRQLAAESDAAYKSMQKSVQDSVRGFLNNSIGGYATDMTTANKGLLELIASKESGGDYNATLDNGKYSGGQRDLVNMTINEVLAMQKQMLAHPDNHHNSSAAGRYQIVGRTLRGLMDTLGLDGSEMFDPAMQDRLAMELIRQRRGQGVDGLRQEWQGLNNVPLAAIQHALGQSVIPGIDPDLARQQTEAQRELNAEIAERQRLQDQAAATADRFAMSLDQQLADLELEAQLTGRTAGETARLRIEHELLQRAQAQGVSVSADMRRKIDQIGDAAAKAADRVPSLGASLKQTFVDAAMSAGSFEDALDQALNALKRMAIEALLLGQGPLAGMFGMGAGGGLLGMFGLGFANGGYTGAGGKFVPAGIVHRGEYVMSQEATSRIGVGNLDALHRTAQRGYSSGGLVGAAANISRAVSGQSGASEPVSQPITINAPVTVQASGGSPEQNNDLAKKVSREIESTMRGVVVDEIRRQMRPGNMIGKRR